MSAINRQPKKTSGINSMLIIGGVIALVSVLLLAYLMWYVTPEENIGSCQAQPGEYIVVPVDQKTKERAAAMNPTR